LKPDWIQFQKDEANRVNTITPFMALAAQPRTILSPLFATWGLMPAPGPASLLQNGEK
jgi:hypothetical protein